MHGLAGTKEYVLNAKHIPETDEDIGRDHLLWMIEQIQKFHDEGHESKAQRWLGFIQGVLSTTRDVPVIKWRDVMRQLDKDE